MEADAHRLPRGVLGYKKAAVAHFLEELERKLVAERAHWQQEMARVEAGIAGAQAEVRSLEARLLEAYGEQRTLMAKLEAWAERAENMAAQPELPGEELSLLVGLATLEAGTGRLERVLDSARAELEALAARVARALAEIPAPSEVSPVAPTERQVGGLRVITGPQKDHA
jgi:chromosome segregation ATPase